MPQFSKVEEAIDAIRKGSFVIVVDNPDRENEGDLIIAAESMTTEKMSFLLRHTSGVVCVPMLEERLEALNLPLMVTRNTESHRTAFTISCDLREGTSTGISSADRALTVRALADPKAHANDFRRPGHIFPLQARKGGVLKRAGHTEAAVDLCVLAGCEPVSVLCEIVNEDRSMARVPELLEFAKKHQLPIISITDLVRYRMNQERIVRPLTTAQLPTPYGTFTAYAYKSNLDDVEHLALVMGDVEGAANVLVRVHSECLTGDLFASKRCDCGDQLKLALEKIGKEGQGVLIYLRGQEGRGIGLGHKIRAYSLQEQGFDTVEANIKLGLPVDSREYGIGAQILADLGITTIRLMTNNPAKYGGLSGYGLTIVERISLVCKPTSDNFHYLKTKQQKLGHLIDPEVFHGATSKN